eukprot:6750939-Pyramimonas_sp.AAC.1
MLAHADILLTPSLLSSSYCPCNVGSVGIPTGLGEMRRGRSPHGGELADDLRHQAQQRRSRRQRGFT